MVAQPKVTLASHRWTPKADQETNAVAVIARELALLSGIFHLQRQLNKKLQSRDKRSQKKESLLLLGGA